MCIVHRSDLHFVEPLIEIRRLTKKQSISDGELLFSSPDRKKHKAFSMSNLNSPRRDSDSSNSDNDQPGMILLRFSQFEGKNDMISLLGQEPKRYFQGHLRSFGRNQMLKLRKAGNHLYKPLFDTKSKVTEMVSQNLPLGDFAIILVSVDPVRPTSVSRNGINTLS